MRLLITGDQKQLALVLSYSISETPQLNGQKSSFSLPSHLTHSLGGVVVRSRTSDSEVVGSSPTRIAFDLEQVIYTHGARANSAFHPSRICK